MDFSLSEEQRILRDSIIQFAQAELNHAIRERDHDHRFERTLWEKCAAMGLPGLPVDEQYGGSSADPVTTAVALEALGYGCHDSGLNFSLCAHLLACVIPIWKHGSAQQKAQFLPRLCDGRWIAVNAMTEAETGSDSFAMRTRAIACDNGWLLNGAKTFCTNGPVADVAVVYAVTDPDKGFHGGVTVFLVTRDSAGFSCGQRFEKMGLRTSPISELLFNNVFVPHDRVLGAVGGGAPLFTESMDWERALLVACHLGTMQRLLETAIEHARTRRQYGQIIGKFQAISHRIVDIKVRLDAARLLTFQAASQLGNTWCAGRDAAIAKLYTSEALIQTAHDVVQVLGGYGFMAEYHVERALRDATASTIYSGTSEIQRNIIARWLGL